MSDLHSRAAAAVNNVAPAVSMGGFAAAWYWGDIYIATAALMAMLTAHLLLLTALERRLHKPTFFTWLLVVTLGALTLLLRDKAFIQMKTSVIYGALALILLGSDACGKNLPRLLLDKFFDAPAAVWRRVSGAACVYFALLAACNYLVATYLSEAAWVGIKTFGFPALTFCFTLAVIFYLYRYLREEQAPS